MLAEVLSPLADRVAERELRSTVRVDGFLAPIGDRRKNTYTSGVYSGRSHRCGFNVQVVASWRGRLVMTGDPMPGAMHDARAWRESGLAQRFVGRLHADGGPGGFADSGYTGAGRDGPWSRFRIPARSGPFLWIVSGGGLLGRQGRSVVDGQAGGAWTAVNSRVHSWRQGHRSGRCRMICQLRWAMRAATLMMSLRRVAARALA